MMLPHFPAPAAPHRRIRAVAVGSAMALALPVLAGVIDGPAALPTACVLSGALMLGWAISWAVRPRTLSALDAAVAEERARISDELHDFVAHDITVVMIHAQALAVNEDPVAAEEARQAISRSAGRALQSIRRTVLPESDPRGLSARIRSAGEELAELGYRVRCDAEVPTGLAPASRAALEHVVTESVTNVIKHGSCGGEVHIGLSADPEACTVTIRNSAPRNSAAADDPRNVIPGGGTGLRRLREMLGCCGGTFTAGPAEQGWLVSARVPRDQSAPSGAACAADRDEVSALADDAARSSSRARPSARLRGRALIPGRVKAPAWISDVNGPTAN